MPSKPLALLIPLAAIAAQLPDDKPAEQAFRNIQVLKGLPQSQLLTTMFFIRASLGVSCEHCHSDAGFEKDEKPAKLRAREMIRMVRQLNQTQFGGRATISCNTCHRGSLRPEASPAFAEIVQAQPKQENPAIGPLPSARQLFARHLQAIGGEAALKRIASRRMKGTRFSSEGWSAPVEIDQQAPNAWIASFTLQARFISAWDGAHGWNHDDQGYHDVDSKDLSELRQDAEFYRDIKLNELFRGAETSGRDMINGRAVYVVHANDADGQPKALYFDVETGLLSRIAGSDPSAFGPLPHVVEYSDYREVDGVKTPFIIGHLRPDFSTLDKFASIEQNVALPPDTFMKPPLAR